MPPKSPNSGGISIDFMFTNLVGYLYFLNDQLSTLNDQLSTIYYQLIGDRVLEIKLKSNPINCSH